MYYIKMEQEGGRPVSDKFITKVSSNKFGNNHTLKFTYSTLENKKSYPTDYMDKDNNNRYHFKDEYIKSLFMMFSGNKELKKSQITSNWIEMEIDTNEKLDTVYIEVSKFGTNKKHISSILKKDNDNNYVSLKDDKFISYLTKSGLNKDAVKLIIAIYVTDYKIKSNENVKSSIDSEKINLLSKKEHHGINATRKHRPLMRSKSYSEGNSSKLYDVNVKSNKQKRKLIAEYKKKQFDNKGNVIAEYKKK